jgi:hypothetical protein
VPTLEATLAFVTACDGNEQLWRRQHASLLTALATGTQPTFLPWPGFNHLDAAAERGKGVRFSRSPGRAEKAALFAQRMRRLRHDCGLTLQEIAAHTWEPAIVDQLGGQGVSVSALSDLCNPRHGRTPTWRTVLGFLLAIDASAAQVERTSVDYRDITKPSLATLFGGILWAERAGLPDTPFTRATLRHVAEYFSGIDQLSDGVTEAVIVPN